MPHSISCNTSIRLYMWQYLWKPFTYAHNDKAQFSLPIDSFINKLTNHHWHTTKSKQVCFCWGCFLRHVRRIPTSAWMALKWMWRPLTSRHWAIDQQITGCCCYPLIWLLFMMFQAQEDFIWAHLEVQLPHVFFPCHCHGSPPLPWLPTTAVVPHHWHSFPPPSTNQLYVVMMKNYLK